MKAMRVVGVALLVLMGGTLAALAAEPQDKPASPLLCGAASSITASSAELPQFFSKPKAKAPVTEGFVVHVCWLTCDRCTTDADCYFDDYFTGPCEAGVYCQ